MAPNYFWPYRLRLWYIIRCQTPRQTLAPHPPGTLHHHHRLGGEGVCRCWPWLDIFWQTLSAQVLIIHGGVYWKSFSEIRPHQTNSHSTHTAQAPVNQVWGHVETYPRGGHQPWSWHRGCKNYSLNRWITLILCTSCQQQTISSYKWHWIPASSRH